MGHVVTVFRFLVEPQTQIIYGVLLANSSRFKQIQHLFRVDTPVTDISTVSDINRIVRMDGTGSFLLLICVCVCLLKNEDDTVFRGDYFCDWLQHKHHQGLHQVSLYFFRDT